MRSIALSLAVTVIIAQADGQPNNIVLHFNNSYDSFEKIPDLNINISNRIIEEKEKVVFINNKTSDTVAEIYKPGEVLVDSFKNPGDYVKKDYVRRVTFYEIVGNGKYLIEQHMLHYDGGGVAKGDGILYDSNGKSIIRFSECHEGFLFSPHTGTIEVSSNYQCDDSIWFYDNKGKLLNRYLLSEKGGSTYMMSCNLDGKQFKCWSNSGTNELYTFDSLGTMNLHINFYKTFNTLLINFFVSNCDPNYLFLNLFGKDLICADTLGNIHWRVKDIVAKGGYHNALHDFLIINAWDASAQTISAIIFDSKGNIRCKLQEEIIYGNDHMLITKKGDRFYEYSF